MAHGMPDWADRTRLDVVFGFKDDAELAVRLGGTSRYHRGGRIIFSDDFTLGFPKWLITDNPPDSAITLNATVLIVGPQCAQMFQVTSSVDDCILWQAISCAMSRQMALEIDLWLYRFGAKFTMSFTLYDGTHCSPFALQFDIDNDILRYQTQPGIWVTLLDPLSAYFCEEKYNSVKLGVARENNQYKWLILNGQRIDMTGMWVAFSYDSRPSNAKIEFELQNTAGVNTAARIDSVNLTLEEL